VMAGSVTAGLGRGAVVTTAGTTVTGSVGGTVGVSTGRSAAGTTVGSNGGTTSVVLAPARGSVVFVMVLGRASAIGGTVLMRPGTTGVRMGVGKVVLAKSRGAVAVVEGMPAVVVPFLGLRREMEVLQGSIKGHGISSVNHSRSATGMCGDPVQRAIALLLVVVPTW
jgi:hypothetical protein